MAAVPGIDLDRRMNDRRKKWQLGCSVRPLGFQLRCEKNPDFVLQGSLPLPDFVLIGSDQVLCGLADPLALDTGYGRRKGEMTGRIRRKKGER